jgi:hypothetical protein
MTDDERFCKRVLIHMLCEVKLTCERENPDPMRVAELIDYIQVRIRRYLRNGK